MYGAPIGDLNGSSLESQTQPNVTVGTSVSQPTVIIPSAPSKPVPIGLSWNEVQTVDGRVYFHNSATQVSQWEKPDELKSPEEQAVNATEWREYKIWDGRTYFHNPKTKCSVWTTPPEVLLAKSEVDPTKAEVDSSIREYVAFTHEQKSDAVVRSNFLELLREKGITEKMSFNESCDLLRDDDRFNAIESVERRKLLFAAYLSHKRNLGIQQGRDEKRVLYKQAIHDFQHWSQMNESTTHQQMESHFKRREWFKKLDRLDVRKIFELYSQEYIEINKIKKQKLQDTYMQDLKNDILGNDQVKLSSPSVVEEIFTLYKFSDSPFWVGLNDSQKLVVIKSCINQRIREAKLALMNRKSV